MSAAASDEVLSNAIQQELTLTQERRGLPRPGPQAQECDRWQPITTSRWVMRFDPANGVISQLYDRSRDIDVCAGAPGGRIGMLRYHILGAERYRNWVETYLQPDEELWWAAEDFDGPQQDGVFDRDLILATRANDSDRAPR